MILAQITRLGRREETGDRNMSTKKLLYLGTVAAAVGVRLAASLP